jgi:hypothetical protein
MQHTDNPQLPTYDEVLCEFHGIVEHAATLAEEKARQLGCADDPKKVSALFIAYSGFLPTLNKKGGHR